jgi:hypothetical protein
MSLRWLVQGKTKNKPNTWKTTYRQHKKSLTTQKGKKG